MTQQPYYTYYGKYRLKVYKLVTNKYFDISVSIIIFLNVISMAVEHYRMSEVFLNPFLVSTLKIKGFSHYFIDIFARKCCLL